MSSLEQQILNDLATTPEDWKLREILADYYEDNGKPLYADCLRWMAENNKRPFIDTNRSATWFNEDTISDELKENDPASNIPGLLYERLEGGKEIVNHKTFKSVLDAEEAILKAWGN